MTHTIVRRLQPSRGDFPCAGPNAYMALVAVPDGSPGPEGRYLSRHNIRRYGWQIVAKREYYHDHRLLRPGLRTEAALRAMIPQAQSLA